MSNYGTVMPAAYSTAKIASSKRNIARLEKQLMKKRTLRQRFRDWLFEDKGSPEDICIPEDHESVELESRRAVRFTIHQANGGRVVQTRRYDDQKDRNIENLYVITNDMEFGREIDKIITMEALR